MNILLQASAKDVLMEVFAKDILREQLVFSYFGVLK